MPRREVARASFDVDESRYESRSTKNETRFKFQLVDGKDTYDIASLAREDGFLTSDTSIKERLLSF
ncbi:MAG: hypothetical protein ACE5NM_08025 [Sedimentisphaerales bacterium]